VGGRLEFGLESGYVAVGSHLNGSVGLCVDVHDRDEGCYDFEVLLGFKVCNVELQRS
jgi:hypothetical protein